MTSRRAKLTALACHPTKIVNKAEKLTYLYTKIGEYDHCAFLYLHGKKLTRLTKKGSSI